MSGVHYLRWPWIFHGKVSFVGNTTVLSRWRTPRGNKMGGVGGERSQKWPAAIFPLVRFQRSAFRPRNVLTKKKSERNLKIYFNLFIYCYVRSFESWGEKNKEKKINERRKEWDEENLTRRNLQNTFSAFFIELSFNSKDVSNNKKDFICLTQWKLFFFLLKN